LGVALGGGGVGGLGCAGKLPARSQPPPKRRGADCSFESGRLVSVDLKGGGEGGWGVRGSCALGRSAAEGGVGAD
jgi:hypothetical protein